MSHVAHSVSAAVPRTRPDLADPRVTFAAAWFLGVAVAQIRIFSVQRPWSTLTWAVVLIVPIAFALGGSLASAIVGARVASAYTPPQEPSDLTRRRLRLVLVACVVIGWLEQVHQWHAARAIPLLASNIDAARAAQPGGPTIVLTDLLTVAAVFALVIPRHPFSRNARPELALAGAALFGFALAGGRVTVVLPIAIALIARALYWGPPNPRVIVLMAVLVAAGISGLFYLRESQHRNDPFARDLYGHVLPQTPVPLRPLLPLHLALATNYEALARVVDYFPYERPYGHGRYDALGIDLFVPSARNLGTITARLSGPWVTSTVAGPFWADGGMPAVAIGIALVGFATLAAYTCARRTHALRYALVAGHLYFLALFGVYTNLWTQEVDWVLDVSILFVLGAVADGGLRPAFAFTEWRVDRSKEKGGFIGTAPSIAILLAGLVAATLTYELLRTPERPVAATHPSIVGVGPVARFHLPAAFTFGRRMLWASDSDRRGEAAVLWVLEPRAAGAMVHRFAWRHSAKGNEKTWRLAFHVIEPGTTFDVGRWRGKVSLFLLRRTHRGVFVYRTAPGKREGRATTDLAPVPAPRSGSHDLGIATWSGTLPDLIVVDRPATSRARITVYSGETGFHRRVFDGTLLFSGLSGAAWNVDFARVIENSIDPVVLLRDGNISASHRPEVHVLDGASPHRRVLDAPLKLPRTLQRRYVFVAGSMAGEAALYGVDPVRRSIAVFLLH